MNITDAYLIAPMAMDHARVILAEELAVLGNGIGRKKRVEWLEAQRERMCREAALFVPSQLAPFIDSLGTQDAIALLHIVGQNLASMNIGRTFRHLRSAQRRVGLSGQVLDVITVNGAMLLLADDDDFVSSLHRALTPLMQHMESSEAFRSAEGPFNEIMSSHDLETNKQSRAVEYALTTLPNIFSDMPDIDQGTIREIAYMYGRLLDQDIMLSITAIVRHLGAGIFDQLAPEIIDHSLKAYRSVLSALINDRITELSGEDLLRQPDTIAHSMPVSASAPQSDEPSPQDPRLPDLASIDETAAYLRVVRGTVHRLLKSGALTGTHVGRRHFVTRSSIEKYLSL